MSRNKLKKFADNDAAHNVLKPGKDLYNAIKGNWNKEFFKNDNDIVLELACGRGEYTVGLAKQYPNKNFIGIDLKGDRFWRGSQQAIEAGLTNVAFLRCHISLLLHFFADNEVSDIWIVFPDPRKKDRDERRRLTFPRYLAIYQQILRPEGLVRLKTDSPELFDYTLEVLENQPIKDLVYTRELYQSEWAGEHHGITTKYERLFEAAGFSIKYLRFKFMEGKLVAIPKKKKKKESEEADSDS